MPGAASRSTTRVRNPRRAAVRAALSPAGPAPTINRSYRSLSLMHSTPLVPRLYERSRQSETVEGWDFERQFRVVKYLPFLSQPMRHCVAHQLGPVMQTELAHNVRPMAFDRAHAEHQGVCDLYVGITPGDQTQYLELARGQLFARPVSGGGGAVGEIGDQGARHDRMDVAIVSHHSRDGVEELRFEGALYHIAAGPGAHRLAQQLLILVYGKYEHLDLGPHLLQLASGLDPAPAGHADIHQYQVGTQLTGQAQDLVAVARLSDHLQFRAPVK